MSGRASRELFWGTPVEAFTSLPFNLLNIVIEAAIVRVKRG